MGDGLIVTDTEDRITFLNAAAEAILGESLGSIAEMHIGDAVSRVPGLATIYERAKAQAGKLALEWTSGDRCCESRVSELFDEQHLRRGYIMVTRDITEYKIAERALREARQELENRVQTRTAELAAEKEQLAHLHGVAIEISRCATSNEVTTTGVRLACEVLGCDTGSLWIKVGRGAGHLAGNDELSKDVLQGLRHLVEDTDAINRSAELGAPMCIDGHDPMIEAPLADPRFNRVVVTPLFSRGSNIGALLSASSRPDFGEDEDTLRLAEAIASQIAVALENARRYEEAQFLAERDSLTRVLNHRGISQRLEQEVAESDRSQLLLGLVMIDVDNFKLFNDAYGHLIGDVVLKRVARILDTSLRRSDVVGRYGGDEFVVLLPNTGAEAAVQLVERVRKGLEESPIDIGKGCLVPLKMSYGIAIFPHDGTTSSELLTAADANLYRSKQQGGDFITATGGDDYQGPQSLGTFSILDGLVTTVDKKDQYTRRHSDNVTEHALALANKLGLPLETQRLLRIAGLLHDVGKLGVPDHILRKPANLTDEEFKAIKNHVTLGELIIQGIPNQQEVLSAIGAHHERIDGRGYPRGLVGNEIPLLGRILAVTDCYSAMTTDRPYRKALTMDEAKSELRRVAGSQLDPQLVSVFLQILEEGRVENAPRVAFAAPAAASRDPLSSRAAV